MLFNRNESNWKKTEEDDGRRWKKMEEDGRRGWKKEKNQKKITVVGDGLGTLVGYEMAKKNNSNLVTTKKTKIRIDR